MILGDHPRLEHTEEEGGADAATEPAQEEDPEAVAEHRRAGDDVQRAVEQARALPPKPVRQAPRERGADAPGHETCCVEGGHYLLGDVLLVLVYGIDVRALYVVCERRLTAFFGGDSVFLLT